MRGGGGGGGRAILIRLGVEVLEMFLKKNKQMGDAYSGASYM